MRGVIRVVEISGATDSVQTALNAINKVITSVPMIDKKEVENVEVLEGPSISLVKQAMVISKKQFFCLTTKIAPQNSRLIDILSEASGVMSNRVTMNNVLEIIGDKRSIEAGYKLIG